MTNHIHIYSDVGVVTSPFGYILQQSESIQTQWFQYSTELSSANADPWDSRPVGFSDNVKSKYVNAIEGSISDTTNIDLFVAGLGEKRTAFGMNYGNWHIKKQWHPANIQNVYLKNSEPTKQYFLSLYGSRKIDTKTFYQSVDLHVFDHNNNDYNYKYDLLSRIGRTGALLAERGELEFWQLMYVFHNKGSFIPMPDEKQYILEQIGNHTTDDTVDPVPFQQYTNCIQYDIFDLDLESVCNDLDLVYNQHMYVEYLRFLEYADRIIQM